MARPKKSPGSVTAKERLVNAFWVLLETNRLHDISVGMVTAETQCNRGTLYYHFDDLNALASYAVESEFLVDPLFLDGFFALALTGDESLLVSIFATQHIRRLGLILDRGGEELINAIVKTAIVDRWTLMAHPDGSPFSDEDRLLVEFTICGLFGLLSYCAHDPYPESLMTTLAKSRFLKDAAKGLLSGLERTENLAKTDPTTLLETARR